MIKELILHEWLEKMRSPFWRKSLIINILLAIFLALFVFYFVILALYIDVILQKIFPKEDVVAKFTLFLFYYFVIDIVMRFFLQKIPILKIQPYLLLPIRKTKIFNFLMQKSLFTFFNFLPLIILFPFAIKVVFVQKGILFAINWFLSVLFLVFTNSFFVFFLKKKFLLKPLFVFLSVFSFLFLIYLDSANYVLFSVYFQKGIFQIAHNFALLTIPLAFMIVSYWFSFSLMKKYSYLDALQISSDSEKNIKDFVFFDKFGKIGNLIQLELKMLWRGKRSKTYLIIAFFMIPYFLIFYAQELYRENFYFLIALSAVLTAAFSMQYAQLIFAWESKYFNLIHSKPIKSNEYILSKYYLILAFNTISFLLSLPYGFFGLKILAINFAAFLFNCGFSVYLFLFFGCFNHSKIDNSKGAFFNYEGIQIIQMVANLPVIVVPILIFLPFHQFGFTFFGIIAIGVVGLVGLLFRNPILAFITVFFIKNKPKMLAGFRK